jgi:hypothetical protein
MWQAKRANPNACNSDLATARVVKTYPLGKARKLWLLSVTIEERYQASPKDLWCMDLRTGQDVKWRSSTRIRSKCEKAAELYDKISRVSSSEW